MATFDPAAAVLSLNGNPSAVDYMKSKVDGKEMRALQLKRTAKLQSLAATGEASPATILNFNPVPLTLEGGIQGKVPSIVDPAIPDSARHEFVYRGKKFKATSVTIRFPLVYPWLVDVIRKESEDMADGVGRYDVAVCKQIEVAYGYWQAYNQGASDSLNMGGVVIFEGDIHALKSPTIMVPEFARLATGAREFFCKPKPFEQKLAEAIDKQRDFYDMQMTTGQTYHNDPDRRKDINNVHLLWAQFGLDMGYREKPVDWQISHNDPEESCTGCGAGKKRATAYFCHACARPYDPLRAFLDGELAFDSVHMERIPDGDWGLVEAKHRENQQRRRRLAAADPIAPSEASAPEHKPRKSAGDKEKE